MLNTQVHQCLCRSCVIVSMGSQLSVCFSCSWKQWALCWTHTQSCQLLHSCSILFLKNRGEFIHLLYSHLVTCIVCPVRHWGLYCILFFNLWYTEGLYCQVDSNIVLINMETTHMFSLKKKIIFPIKVICQYVVDIQLDLNSITLHARNVTAMQNAMRMGFFKGFWLVIKKTLLCF